MARSKKTRKISDIMPIRKADKKIAMPKNRRQATRYELDAQAREEKKKRKHKGKIAGARNGALEKKALQAEKVVKDPRIGSRKKVPLMVEIINKPQTKPMPNENHAPAKVEKHDPYAELMQLESNECLNELLDQLDAGKKLSADDQKFVDECLDRIEKLMDELGLNEEEEEEDLYRTFNTIDINQFK